jgi:hypothetical protein
VAVGDSAGGWDGVGDLSGAPDGSLLAVLVRDRSARVALISTDGRDIRLFPDDVQPPAAFVGDIFTFTRERQRYASAVDLEGPRLVGEAVPLSESLPSMRVASPVSQGTTAAWMDATRGRGVEPVWVDRSGRATPVGIPAGDIRWPRLSPDGRRLALSAGFGSLSMADLGTGGQTRLVGTEEGTEPVWFHDGRRVVTSLQVGKSKWGLLAHASNGSRTPDTLLVSDRHDSWPTDIPPGDSLVVFYGSTDDDPQDVQILHLRSGEVRRIAMPGEQSGARVSPDGRWIALQSRDVGGGFDIVVLPWPSLDAQHIVTTGGGDGPLWSRDGRELYFRLGERVMVTRVAPGADWSASPPAELLRGPFVGDLYGDQSWDLAPDGRFLMLRAAGESQLEVRVIQNWAAELARKLAESNP